MKKTLLIPCTLFLFVFNVTQAQDLKISQFDFATSIEDREPFGVDTAFAANVGNVFCFTHVEGAADSTQIAHVWYYKEQEKARINLDVESNDWRTWSSKTILESWTGRWRVMIEDNQGNVLATKSFVIKE